MVIIITLLLKHGRTMGFAKKLRILNNAKKYNWYGYTFYNDNLVFEYLL